MRVWEAIRGPREASEVETKAPIDFDHQRYRVTGPGI